MTTLVYHDPNYSDMDSEDSYVTCTDDTTLINASICLEKDGKLSFDLKTNAQTFIEFYSNLTNDLIEKLPNPPDKFVKELYADDTCLIYSDEDTKELKTKLNKDFNSLCNWFIDNKLSIRFREEKTKCILMGTKFHLKKHSESMATKVLGLVNGRNKCLYRTQIF